MSMRSVLGTVSVACALMITGCGDEEENGNEDGGSHSDGGSHAGHDAGHDSQDGGVQSDAGSNNGGSHGDGGSTGDAGSSGDAAVPPDSEGTHFFLPTGEPDNTSAPTVEVDAAGNVHTLYPAYAGGNAYYAFCAAGDSCNGSEDAKVVKLATDGTVANAMLALTADGKPRVLLSAFSKLYFASCEQNCGEQASWTLSMILDHGGKREVTGEALALDTQGRPRFMMHTYRALFGIGQEAPEQIYAQCDGNCGTPASWRYDVVEHEIWYGSDLKIDAQNRVHVGTTVFPYEGTSEKQGLTAYLLCESASCNTVGAFNGIGFNPPYENRTEAVSMHPTISLALTRAGAPRIALLTKNDADKKQMIYYECDQSCRQGNRWSGTILTEHSALGSGLDLALDGNDHPRLVYTFNYNILLRFCDDTSCTAQEAVWDDTLVESSTSIPPDNIFLWDNCTVGAWFLHDPSIALTRNGAVRVGYQSRDISGGFSQPDPTKPGCTAGTDMTWSRLALLPPVK